MSNETPDIHEHAAVSREQPAAEIIHKSLLVADPLCPEGLIMAIGAGGHVAGSIPREPPANDLTARIIALNGADPDPETRAAWLRTGGNWRASYELSWPPGAQGGLLEGHTRRIEAIDAQGRRIDHAQEMERLLAENERLTAQVAEMERAATQQLHNYVNQREKWLEREHELGARMLDYGARMEAAEARVAELETRLQSQGHKLVAAELRVAELEHLYADAQRQHSALELRATAASEVNGCALESLQARLTREREQRQAAEAQARDAQRARDELAAGAAAIQRKIGGIAAQLDAERRAHEATRHELATARSAAGILLTAATAADAENREIHRKIAARRDRWRQRYEQERDAASGTAHESACRMLGREQRHSAALSRKLQRARRIIAALLAQRAELRNLQTEGKACVAAIRAWLRTGPDSSPLRLAERIEAGEWRTFLPGAREDVPR